LTVVRAVSTTVPLALLALLIPLVATPAVASIVVDHNPTPCVTATTHYLTIQSAVSAAPSGATIQICPGNYPEQVTIATPLTLHGVIDTAANTGAPVVTIPGGTFTGTFTQILVEASGVTLSDIGVDGTNTLNSCSGSPGPSLIGIAFGSGSSGTLKQVALRNQNISNGSGGYCGTGTAVSATTLPGATSAASVTITDSSIRNYDGEGVYLVTTSSVTVKTTTVGPLDAGLGCLYANAPTITISDNAMANCEVGVYVTSTVAATVSGNTIIGPSSAAFADASYGVFCFPTCTGLTVSGNQIFDTQTGYSMKTSGGTGGALVENNTISGTTNGVYLFGQPGNTVSGNTFADAQVGVNGVSGNTVSGNTYRTVTTLAE
jgi:parallel beta-helix repeat protein